MQGVESCSRVSSPHRSSGRAYPLEATASGLRRICVEDLQEPMRVHGARMREQGVRGLDHLEVHIRHVAETGARIVRVAAALRDQGTGLDMLPVLRIEL